MSEVKSELIAELRRRGAAIPPDEPIALRVRDAINVLLDTLEQVQRERAALLAEHEEVDRYLGEGYFEPLNQAHAAAARVLAGKEPPCTNKIKPTC